MVEALEISQRRRSEPPPSPPLSRVNNHSAIQADEQPQRAIIAVAVPIEAGSDDEFGMDGDDVFAADLEQVASLYDSRQEVPPEEDQTAPEAPVQAAPAPPVIDFTADDTDDDFGDDIDADEFAAAEVAATQNPITVRRPQYNPT